MTPRSCLRRLLMGIVVSACALALYALAVGLFLALTLLVISMEEGEESVSQSAIPLMEAVVLQSQGIGITWGSVTVTLIPLLLTVLLVALIAALTMQLAGSPLGYLSGVLTWSGLSWIFTQGVTVTLMDPTWTIIAKAAALFSLAYVLGSLGRKPPVLADLIRAAHERIPSAVGRVGRVGIQIVAVVLASSLAAGIIVTTIWAIRNHSGMAALFDMLGMKTGSRILTTLCTLIWLPNIWLWGLSWMCGSGFSIGSDATFTLWSGSATDLPPIPLLGILPDAVGNDALRTTLLLVPVAIGFAAMLAMLLSSRAYRLRPVRTEDPHVFLTSLLSFLAPAASMLVAVAVLSAAFSALFALSNGALGTDRLAHVGVNVAQATRAVTRSAAWGMLAAWTLVLIVFCAVFATKWLHATIRTRLKATPKDFPEGSTKDSPGDGPRIVSSQPPTKEENDGSN